MEGAGTTMADKSYTFVETTDSDNGYDKWSNFWRFGTKRAVSVQDMVDQIVADLQPDDCIKKLTVIGHGGPGNISVGNGQSGTDPAKEINGNNEAQWGPQLDRLRCRFCTDGLVYLRGCNVGEKCRVVGTFQKIGQTYSIKIIDRLEYKE